MITVRSFESFVVGPDNQQAYLAARAITPASRTANEALVFQPGYALRVLNTL